jgi:ornithine cyclodeaminase/alanine dehydrogenase-like protein (mu-crystallin family)
MTWLLTNDEVEQALTPQDAIAATECIYRELAEGKAINRPRSQTYMPVESQEHPGFRYRMKTQEGSGVSSGVWALRITSDMAGFSYTAGVKRRRILPVASGNRYCGMVILFDLEKIEPIAIMPDGWIQKVRVVALRVVGAE